MKVCFPVETPQGLASDVYGHFGSAPAFVIVETSTNTVTTIQNKNQHHAHGACSPLAALGSRRVDAIVVGGIGAGALNKLRLLGIKVYRAQAPGIEENIHLLKARKLSEISLEQICAGKGYGHGCGH